MESRLLRWISPEVRSDVPVQAALDLIDVLGVLEAERSRKIRDARESGALDGNGLVAEVEIVVLDLDRPIVPDRPLDARSHRPADLARAAGAAGAGERRKPSSSDSTGPVAGVVSLRPGDAGLSVNQPAVMRDAEGAGGGTDPLGVSGDRPAEVEHSRGNAIRAEGGGAG